MTIARRYPDAARPCHRCGWTADLRRVSRREARGLGISTAQRWLCADCRAWRGGRRTEVGRAVATRERQRAEADRRIMA